MHVKAMVIMCLNCELARFSLFKNGTAAVAARFSIFKMVLPSWLPENLFRFLAQPIHRCMLRQNQTFGDADLRLGSLMWYLFASAAYWHVNARPDAVVY